jgi:hypothetical protein
MAALARHRSADDPQLAEARDTYADHLARTRLQRMTPGERRKLLVALVALGAFTPGALDTATAEQTPAPVLDPEPANP